MNQGILSKGKQDKHCTCEADYGLYKDFDILQGIISCMGGSISPLSSGRSKWSRGGTKTSNRKNIFLKFLGRTRPSCISARGRVAQRQKLILRSPAYDFQIATGGVLHDS